MEYTVYTPSSGLPIELLSYHECHLGLAQSLTDLVDQSWNWLHVMLWECCDRGGQPSAGILVADPETGHVEVEPGCAGTAVISELWGKGGTEPIFRPSLKILQLIFPTRSLSGLSVPFTSARPAVHFLFSPISPIRFLYLASPAHIPTSNSVQGDFLSYTTVGRFLHLLLIPSTPAGD